MDPPDSNGPPRAGSDSSGSVLVKQEPIDDPTIYKKPDDNVDAIPASMRTEQSQAPSETGRQLEETHYLEHLCTSTDASILETGVSVARYVMDQLENTIIKSSNPEATSWRKAFQDIRDQATPTRTVVGVVGNTGAGKSSVINALLDEERLLPTNCLRACTASPTEISFNYSEDPQELYRAEIEFISKLDWVRELEVLFSDLLDANGNVSRECTNGDSDAGVAYAKVKAVYPHKTKDMISQANPADLADEASVRGLLGSVKVLKATSAQDLYKGLQYYVDSKEKVSGTSNRRNDVPMEYWPLIKVVRIHTKADALTTGAVIVDLPGVQDSNAARAAVAATYMKSCRGLWIVAPINRAVDDKTAKNLLGDAFKRQLKFDGSYSAVSFICSKTDDISITEAAESLNLEAQVADKWDEAEGLKQTRKNLQMRSGDLKKTKKQLADESDEVEELLELWEELDDQLTDGQTVFAPLDSKKRKRAKTQSRQRKPHGSSDIEDYFLGDDSSEAEHGSRSDTSRLPLTAEEIEDKLNSIRVRRKQIRKDRNGLSAQMSEVRDKMQHVQNERELILSEVKAACIKGRNEYSRGAIKRDFAMGVKELDEETALEKDESAYNPEEDIRDYEAVAHQLPVFCVSSRAYQCLRNRLQKDEFQSNGFLSTEDTEVPQLQAHAKKLTEAVRVDHCSRILNDLLQVMNTMKLWALSDGTQLTATERKDEESYLRQLLAELEKGLAIVVESATDSIEKHLDENIYQTCNATIPIAIAAAVDTSSDWGLPRSMGGLLWSTYRATVRRDGIFSGASGPRDFNAELFEPITKDLASAWERTFQRLLPKVLQKFSKEAKERLNEFQQAARQRAEQSANVTGLVTLGNQIVVHMRTIDGLPNALRRTIIDLQRDANRGFTPIITDIMRQTYQNCAQERGSSCFLRMKDTMALDVGSLRHSMFRRATDSVKEQLEAMRHRVRKEMTDAVAKIYEYLFRNFMRAIG
ncbi:hypothetical protein F5Y15DRAFT_426715 [Xylariaceae sp. FL0016]|nr:hypothetical protein F5Y15DRAFT_426715 [Xylariaceae sp. FL0016]